MRISAIQVSLIIIKDGEALYHNPKPLSLDFCSDITNPLPSFLGIIVRNSVNAFVLMMFCIWNDRLHIRHISLCDQVLLLSADMFHIKKQKTMNVHTISYYCYYFYDKFYNHST
jgi:hypothetical protein